MVVNLCTSTRTDGQPCTARALPESAYCFAHDPAVRQRRIEGNRRGGQAKSNAARAARQWAAIGREVPDEDLPAVIKALIFSVRSGAVEPAVATCIAGLAKTALQLHSDIDLERRIEALERDAGYQYSQGLRKVR